MILKKEMSNTAFNLSHGMITKALSVILSVIIVPIVFKSLGAENFGWIGIYTICLGSLYIFDFGISNIVTKEIAQSKIDAPKIFHSFEFIYLSIGITISILLFLFAPLIASDWVRSSTTDVQDSILLIRLIALAFFVQWPHSFYTAALFGVNRQIRSNNIQIIFSLLKNLGLVLLVWFKLISIFNYFYFQILISILTSLILRVSIMRELNSPKLSGKISFTYLHELKNFVLGMSLVGLLGFVYNDLNHILLSRWLSLADFGLYNIALYVASSFILISSTIKNSLFSAIASSVDSELKLIRTQYQYHFNIMSFVCIPGAVFIFIHSHTILFYWFDLEMAEKLNWSLKYFAAGSLFYTLMIIPGAYLIANERSKYLIYNAGILALISIPLLYFLVENFQFEGGSLFWLLINFIPFGLMILYTQKTILKDAFINISKGIVLPLGISIVFFGLHHFLNSQFHFSLLSHFMGFLLSCSLISYILIKELIKNGRIN